jgi:hypothetical protein
VAAFMLALAALLLIHRAG